MADFLAKERIVAGPGFNRWLVPPAALCIHLCIGMAYGFSVFWIPLTKALGITKSIPCPADMSWLGKLFTLTCWLFGIKRRVAGAADREDADSRSHAPSALSPK